MQVKNWHAILIKETMFLLSTIIYLHEIPTGYNVFREENGFVFAPAVHTQNKDFPPVIRVILSGNELLAPGASGEVTEQVLKIIRLNGLNKPYAKLSAAC
jgi:hypothetical protein